MLCFDSQIGVGCGVTMKRTISFPLWYIFCFTLLCHAFLVVSECLWILCVTCLTRYSSNSGILGFGFWSCDFWIWGLDFGVWIWVPSFPNPGRLHNTFKIKSWYQTQWGTSRLEMFGSCGGLWPCWVTEAPSLQFIRPDPPFHYQTGILMDFVSTIHGIGFVKLCSSSVWTN